MNTRSILRKLSVTTLGAYALIACAVTMAQASAPTGAIFTTLIDGSEVNYNQYGAKEDVYLDGGPGPGAPADAAGLDDGTYIFQVTDPSGRTLLSTDPAICRQFVVAGGVITGVVVTGCEHETGDDNDHDAKTVQLYPFDDTPNNGGVYKVWATKYDDFLNECLDVVDCGRSPGYLHGFKPSYSKTDNFKVTEGPPLEIDTRFFNDLNSNGKKEQGENWIDGLQIKWRDPLLASNMKSSYENLSLDIHHEAHVEAVESGMHQIEITDQTGCDVGAVYVNGQITAVDGPQIVQVPIRGNMKEGTIFVDVACKQLH